MDELNIIPEVVQVIPTRNFEVYVYFDTGHIKLFNARHLLEAGPVFTPLKDIDTFINTCTVLNRTLSWDFDGNYDTTNCVDIDPFVLFECKDVEDPLS